MVRYFRVVGDGASASEPQEEVVATARAAVQAKFRLQRLCGRAGKVTVWGKDGRLIGDSKMARLAREELAASGDLATDEFRGGVANEGCHEQAGESR